MFKISYTYKKIHVFLEREREREREIAEIVAEFFFRFLKLLFKNIYFFIINV